MMKRLTTMPSGLGFGLFVSVLLLLAAGVTSCSKEEDPNRLPDGAYPMNLTASVEGQTATRALVDNTWAGGEKIAVQINNEENEVKEYTAAVGGKLSSTTPFYWQNTAETKTVSAWYPHSPTRPTSFTVQEDQRDGCQQSDLLYAAPIQVKFKSSSTLLFKHLLVKVVVNLKNGDGVTEDEVTKATVTIENQATTSGTIGDDWVVKQMTEGNKVIKPNALTSAPLDFQKSVQALLVPQQMQDKKFIKVAIGSINYFYTPTNNTDAKLEAGNQHTYNITVKKKGLEVTVENNDATWIDSEQDGSTAEAAKFRIHGGDGMALIAGDGGKLSIENDYKELSGTNLLKVTVAKQSDKFLKGISISGISVMQSWKSDGTNYEIIYQLKSDITLKTSDFVTKFQPEVGSYFYADGEWSTELWSKPCIGIVFKVGVSSDTDSYKDMNGNSMSTINGYVVALEDASAALKWADKDGKYSVSVGTSTNDKDWKGYFNCQQIKNYTTEGWSIAYFPAANACLNFGTAFTKYAAPSSSSGWFLPSCGQLRFLYDNGDILSSKIDKLKTISGYENIKWFEKLYYWSSSEHYNNSANIARIFHLDDGNAGTNYKYSGYNVRGVFAF